MELEIMDQDAVLRRQINQLKDDLSYVREELLKERKASKHWIKRVKTLERRLQSIREVSSGHYASRYDR